MSRDWITKPDWEEFPDAEWFTPEGEDDYAVYFKYVDHVLMHRSAHAKRWHESEDGHKRHLIQHQLMHTAIRNQKSKTESVGENSWLDS